MLSDLPSRSEGDVIAETLCDGKDGETVPALLGQVVGVERLWAESGGEKMPIIHEDILHPRLTEVLHDRGLPDALRKPEPPGPHAEAAVEILAHHRHLAPSVLPWKGRQDRFVEAGTEGFNQTRIDKTSRQLQLSRVVGLAPLEEGAAQVETHLEAGDLPERLKEGAIGPLGHLFKDPREIPQGLVVVNAEEEVERHIQP